MVNNLQYRGCPSAISCWVEVLALFCVQAPASNSIATFGFKTGQEEI